MTSTLRPMFMAALKSFMLAHDELGTSTLRLIMAGVKDDDIKARAEGNMEGVDDPRILKLLQGMVKQRRESAEAYEGGGRPELAARERAEIKIIEQFLPAQMSEEEMHAAIRAAITALEAKSIKDMGRVMNHLREKHAGSMDFSLAGPLLKQHLMEHPEIV